MTDVCWDARRRGERATLLPFRNRGEGQKSSFNIDKTKIYHSQKPEGGGGGGTGAVIIISRNGNVEFSKFARTDAKCRVTNILTIL